MTEPPHQRHAGRRDRSVVRRFDEGKEWADPMSDDNRIMAIRHYLHNGWSIVPLHDVHNGPCSCGNPRNDANHDFKQGGKHPIAGAWQQPENQITSEADAIAYWHNRPHANIGLATGHTFWVLDEDTYNGADLDALIGERDWPTTHTVRTGSGGRQFYFALPDFVVTQGMYKQIEDAGFPGFDIRGMGGQVVAPPSVSGKGAYSVLDGAPIVPAPAWLLDMIRPAERAQDWSTPSGAATGQVVPDLEIGTPRAIKYAMPSLTAECRDFGALMDGRQQEAFPFACRVIELANRAGMPRETAHDWYMQACAVAVRNGNQSGLTPGEARRVWRNAEQKVGDKPAEMGPPPPTAFEQISEGLPIRSPFVAAVSADGPEGKTGESWETPGQSVPETLDPVEAMLAKMIDSAGLDDIEPLEPLITGVLSKDSFARVNGPSGSGKSLVTLDMAGCVGTGINWHGHAVTSGDVVYIVAEGISGMRLRVRSWEAANHRRMTGVRFFPEPVQAAADEWHVLIEACRRLKPALIVIDTQARVTVGVDENSNTDMGLVVDRMERLRAATGACVLLVHHRGLNGEHGRGASAVRGALQTELDVERAGTRVTLRQTKQKDSEELGPMRFRMVTEPLDTVTGLLGLPEVGVTLASDITAIEQRVMSADELQAESGRLAVLMAEVFSTGNGGTRADVLKVVKERKLKLASSAFYRAWNDLVEKSIIGRVHGSQSWKYVDVEDRRNMTEPINPDDSKAGRYAP